MRRLVDALTQIDTLQDEKQGLSDEVAACEAIHSSKLEELHDAQASLQEPREHIASRTSAMTEMESDRETLESKLEAVVGDKSSTEEQVAKLEVAKHEEEKCLADALAHIDTHQDEKQGLSDEVPAWGGHSFLKVGGAT
jgi:chromosome segregation ATPase